MSMRQGFITLVLAFIPAFIWIKTYSKIFLLGLFNSEYIKTRKKNILFYIVNRNALDSFGLGLYIGSDGDLIAGIDTSGYFNFNPPGSNEDLMHINSVYRHRKDTEDILVPEEVANRGIKFLIRTQSLLRQSTIGNMNLVNFAKNPDYFREVLIAKIARLIELAGRNN